MEKDTDIVSKFVQLLDNDIVQIIFSVLLILLVYFVIVYDEFNKSMMHDDNQFEKYSNNISKNRKFNINNCKCQL